MFLITDGDGYCGNEPEFICMCRPAELELTLKGILTDRLEQGLDIANIKVWELRSEVSVRSTGYTIEGLGQLNLPEQE
jgi:hypothetical protein